MSSQPPSHRRKISLAAALVEQGFFAQADEACRWILAGDVFVNEQRLDKPGMLINRDAHLRVRGHARYASRGGYKLATALEYFAVQVEGQIALDCGASTGGFTDCLLKRGAALVYAVEVGYGQLVGRLRADPRVRNWEQTNLSGISRDMLDPLPTLITLDLSYLSLTQAIPTATGLLAPSGMILALIKPLFEVMSSQARRTGQIEQATLVVEALQRVIAAGISCGLALQGIAKLALQPRHGVHEFFVCFIRSAGTVSCQLDEHDLQTICSGPGIGPREPDEAK